METQWPNGPIRNNSIHQFCLFNVYSTDAPPRDLVERETNENISRVADCRCRRLGSVGDMSSQYRRPRGTPKVALNLFVSPEVKQRIDSYAKRADVPIWAIVEAAVNAGQPDEDGIPKGWDLPRHPRLDDADDEPGGGPVRRTA